MFVMIVVFLCRPGEMEYMLFCKRKISSISLIIAFLLLALFICPSLFSFFYQDADMVDGYANEIFTIQNLYFADDSKNFVTGPLIPNQIVNSKVTIQNLSDTNSNLANYIALLFQSVFVLFTFSILLLTKNTLIKHFIRPISGVEKPSSPIALSIGGHAPPFL